MDVYLGIGSNIGDRLLYLEKSLLMLSEHEGIEIKAKSSIYETEPYGLKEQSSFLNMVVQVKTELNPEQLLKYIHEVEQRLDRERKIRWGPRTIDIDILLYGKESINLPHLQVPHPYIQDRLFVLMPLREIYEGKIPGKIETIDQFIQKLRGKQGIEVYQKRDR